MELVITRSGNSAHAKVRGEIVQSQFGLRPYRGMVGALKVCDMVEIRADLNVVLGDSD